MCLLSRRITDIFSLSFKNVKYVCDAIRSSLTLVVCSPSGGNYTSLGEPASPGVKALGWKADRHRFDPSSATELHYLPELWLGETAL